MTVRLMLDDGTVREYPVACLDRGILRARCGAWDCEHPECALALAGRMREAGKAAIALFSFLVLLAIASVILLDYPSMSWSVGRIQLSLLLAVLLLLLFAVWYADRPTDGSGAACRELEEFIHDRTVNGRPAKQLPARPRR